MQGAPFGEPFVLSEAIVQKLFNVMSVAAFTMSAGMVVGSVLLYSRIPSLTKRYISELKLEMTQMVSDMLPMKVDQAMPPMPKTTGLPVPVKSPF
jgi:hypothetical protein|tara:strand:+ start:228 stop:512 length:285 start_codon:yes stop_codon:yes gene_type:complete